MKKIVAAIVSLCLLAACGCTHTYYVGIVKTQFGQSNLLQELPDNIDAPNDVKMVFSTFVQKYQELDGYVEDFNDPRILTNDELVIAGLFMAGTDSSNVTTDTDNKHYIISYQSLVNQLSDTYNLAKFDSLYLSKYYNSDQSAFVVPISDIPQYKANMGVITACSLQNGEMDIKADFYTSILVNVLEGRYELYKTETAGYQFKRVNGSYVLNRNVVYFKSTGVNLKSISKDKITSQGAVKQ